MPFVRLCHDARHLVRRRPRPPQCRTTGPPGRPTQCLPSKYKEDLQVCSCREPSFGLCSAILIQKILHNATSCVCHTLHCSTQPHACWRCIQAHSMCSSLASQGPTVHCRFKTGRLPRQLLCPSFKSASFYSVRDIGITCSRSSSTWGCVCTLFVLWCDRSASTHTPMWTVSEPAALDWTAPCTDARLAAAQLRGAQRSATAGTAARCASTQHLMHTRPALKHKEFTATPSSSAPRSASLWLQPLLQEEGACIFVGRDGRRIGCDWDRTGGVLQTAIGEYSDPLLRSLRLGSDPNFDEFDLSGLVVVGSPHSSLALIASFIRLMHLSRHMSLRADRNCCTVSYCQQTSVSSVQAPPEWDTEWGAPPGAPAPEPPPISDDDWPTGQADVVLATITRCPTAVNSASALTCVFLCSSRAFLPAQALQHCDLSCHTLQHVCLLPHCGSAPICSACAPSDAVACCVPQISDFTPAEKQLLLPAIKKAYANYFADYRDTWQAQRPGVPLSEVGLYMSCFGHSPVFINSQCVLVPKPAALEYVVMS